MNVIKEQQRINQAEVSQCIERFRMRGEALVWARAEPDSEWRGVGSENCHGVGRAGDSERIQGERVKREEVQQW